MSSHTDAKPFSTHVADKKHICNPLNGLAVLNEAETNIKELINFGCNSYSAQSSEILFVSSSV